MAFDVIHFEPAKGAVSTSMEAEEDRTEESKKTPNADPKWARWNFSIHAIAHPTERGKVQFVYDKLHWSDKTKQQRLEERLSRQTTMTVTRKDGSTYQKSATIRKDAVTHINFIISGDHDVLHQMLMDDVREMNADKTGRTNFPRIRKWAMDNFTWLAEKAGGARNIITFNVHLDESTPHIQATIVPMYYNKETKECRLNHKRFCDGPYQMKQIRTDHAEKVGAKYGLERGIEGSKSTHEDIGDFYRRLKQADNAAARLILQEIHEGRDTARSALATLKHPAITSLPPTFGKEKWVQEQNELIRKREEALKEKHLKVIKDVAEQALRTSAKQLHANQKQAQELAHVKAELNKRDSVMNKIENAFNSCCKWAAKCIRGTAVMQWLYESFNTYCEAKGFPEVDDQVSKRARYAAAAEVWLNVVDPDNQGARFGKFTEEQQEQLQEHLDRAALHPEIGRGQGLSQGV